MIYARYATEHETIEQTTEQLTSLLTQMKELESLKYHPEVFGDRAVVEFFGFPSMNDQKVICNPAACDCLGMANCPLCRATPTMVLKNQVKKFVIKNRDWLRFGISDLHYLIRSFENLFKLGFRGDFRKHYATEA